MQRRPPRIGRYPVSMICGSIGSLPPRGCTRHAARACSLGSASSGSHSPAHAG